MTWVAILLLAVLADGLPAWADDAPVPGDGASAAEAVAGTDGGAAAAAARPVPAASAAPRSGGWTVETSTRALGRGAGVSGNRRQFLEDYDTLDSGGGAETRFSGDDGRGNYFDGAASILGQEHGEGVDGAEVHVRGGHRGLYTVTGDLSRTRSYFDDHLKRAGGGTVAPAELGRDLDLVRTNGRLAAELRLGERGRVGVVYQHREADGDESLIKGSVVERLSPYAFRFPAFKTLDLRSDALDVDGDVPAGPLDVRLTAGFTDQHDRTTVHERNVGADSAVEGVRFTDDFDTTVVRAGAEVSTPPDWALLARAGYRFVWVDGDADTTQQTGSILERSADGISVTERNHTGHTGFAYAPLPHLLVRTAYTILDQHRDGDGLEVRRAGTTFVQSDATKDLRRHRPRVEITYTGLPRTLLRASYRYERSTRDLEAQMLGAASDPLAGVDRVEATTEDKDLHLALVEARYRATQRLLLSGGYRLRREKIDESVDQLLNEDTLGDRDRELHAVFLGGRYRAERRLTLEARGELQHDEYDRTDAPGDSKTSVDAETATLRAIAMPMPRLLVTGLFSVANRDYDVGTPRRNLSFFAPIEFRGRALSGAIATTYTVDDRTSVNGQYTLVDAGGSLDNLTHRLFVGAGYRVSDRLRVGAGYAYLSFDQGLYDGRDYEAHVGWASVSVAFPPG
jgi:hypothetical protein